ncbi:MAG: alpha/beta hydrolase [Halopseudomonas sp.]
MIDRLLQPPQPPAPGRIHKRTVAGCDALTYYLQLPHLYQADTPISVCVHGISRNAKEMIEAFAGEAAENRVLIAPLFRKQDYPRYQQPGISTADRSDLALLEILADVGRLTGVDSRQFDLFGYSGGAQFAQRFSLFEPERIRSLSLTSAGWYSWPDASLRYPYGVGSRALRSTIDLQKFLALPCQLIIGSDDSERDSSLNCASQIDRVQGNDRWQRAQNWLQAMTHACEKHQIDNQPQWHELAGQKHSFGDNVRQAELVGKVCQFWNQTLQKSAKPAAIYCGDYKAALPVSQMLYRQ